MPIVLYCHHESGHSYKVALALRWMGVPFEQRPVNLNVARPERTADFRDAAAFGEVPVLVLEDGLTICQSNAILDTLARRHEKLDGADAATQIKVREWLAWEGCRIGVSLPNLRFSRHFTPYGQAIEEWLEARVRRDLDRLEAAVIERPFLTGDRPTIADVSCSGYLHWLDHARLNVAEWPSVARWLERLRSEPGWLGPYDLLMHAYPLRPGTLA
ncbi:glutathione S-transferase family protein [Pendulispora albinea]|uniref:Glutathione S-transferase family protein n=1 Tax=Pendulispora albinea TaxID=2741071 RepID=A0ABZ2LR40_9BACT